MTTILGVGNLLDASTAMQGNSAASTSLLRLLPPEYGFLMLLLTHATGCTAFSIPPPSPPDGGDGGQECTAGERRTTYSGSIETVNVGVCRPRIEECVATTDGNQYQIVQEEILPSDEICDGLDNDCLGPTLGEEEWSRTFGGEGNDFLYTFQQTSDGGFILAGSTGGNGWLIKTDEDGFEEWDRTYERTEFQSIQLASDGGFIVAGSEVSSITRIESTGVERWSRTFGVGIVSGLLSIQLTDDGGFIAAGYRGRGGGDPPIDGWLVKVDSEGIEQWNRTFCTEEGVSGLGHYFFRAIQPITDGGFVAVGNYHIVGGSSDNGWLVRVDDEGIEQWNSTFGGDRDDYFYSLLPNGSRGFLLAGNSAGRGWLVETDENGMGQWVRSYGDTNWYSSFFAIRPMGENGFIAAGVTGGGSDGWLVRIGDDGVEEWSMVLGGDYNDHFFSVQQANDGSIVAVGSTDSFGAGLNDGWMVKVCVE